MKPNCYECQYRRSLTWDAHSECSNLGAHTTFAAHGIRNGWALWPFNFDPVWLESCDGFRSIHDPTFAYEATLTVVNDSPGDEAIQLAKSVLTKAGLSVSNAEEGFILSFTANRELNEQELSKMTLHLEKTLNQTVSALQWSVTSIRRQSGNVQQSAS